MSDGAPSSRPTKYRAASRAAAKIAHGHASCSETAGGYATSGSSADLATVLDMLEPPGGFATGSVRLPASWLEDRSSLQAWSAREIGGRLGVELGEPILDQGACLPVHVGRTRDGGQEVVARERVEAHIG